MSNINIIISVIFLAITFIFEVKRLQKAPQLSLGLAILTTFILFGVIMVVGFCSFLFFGLIVNQLPVSDSLTNWLVYLITLFLIFMAVKGVEKPLIAKIKNLG